MARNLLRSLLFCFALLGLAASTADAACGDGYSDDGEGCDDGNVADGDGCSSGCVLEPALGRHCELTFSQTDSVELGALQLVVDYAGAGHFTGVGSSVQCVLFPFPGLDLSVANDVDSELSLTLAAVAELGFNGPADLWRCQFDIQTEVGENPVAADLPIEIYEATDIEGNPVSPVIELTGVDCETGSVLCGDAVLQSWEECDDGNGASGDGCGSDCSVEPCFECVTTSDPSTCEPVSCDDGNPCTDDSCNADSGECAAVDNGDTCCDVTFRLTSTGTLGALQAVTDYSAAGGHFEGSASGVECSNLISSLHAHDDVDASSELTLGWVSLVGFAGPLDMGQCSYHAAGDSRPAAGDFAISILDSRDLDDITVDASFVIGDITCNTDCPPAPSSGCLEAGASLLVVKDSAKDEADKLVWKWKKGAAFAFDDLADPTANARYRVCLYPDSGAALETIATPASALWSAKTGSGYTYKDKDGTNGGVTGIKIKTGDDEKTSIQVKGRSLALPADLLPAGAHYTIQLREAGGQCWSSAFTAGETKNGQYKAKVP